MLRPLLLGLVIAIVALVATASATVCPVPLAYRIGTVDPRFHLSSSSIDKAVTEAVTVWEKTTGRDLFVVSTSTDALPVNFIFDDRQERLVSEASLRENLDTKEYTTEEIKAEYEKLSKTYDAMKEVYEKDAAAYEARLAAYNKKVDAFNSTENGSEATYASLQKEKRALEAQLQKLETSSKKLDTTAAQINDIGTKGNAIIEQFNAGVRAYNERFSEPDEFTQGEYTHGSSTQIDIYSFKNNAELVNVLAHEFGHALGIEHVEGSSSIMYYLMADQSYPPTLSFNDTNAFIAVCGAKDSTLGRVRVFLNHYLFSYFYG